MENVARQQLANVQSGQVLVADREIDIKTSNKT